MAKAIRKENTESNNGLRPLPSLEAATPRKRLAKKQARVSRTYRLPVELVDNITRHGWHTHRLATEVITAILNEYYSNNPQPPIPEE